MATDNTDDDEGCPEIDDYVWISKSSWAFYISHFPSDDQEALNHTVEVDGFCVRLPRLAWLLLCCYLEAVINRK